jgi:hypothetical protein
MNITTISATYERKHNLGDYNSANIGMTLWAQLEPDEDEAAAAIALRDMARNHVMTELARLDKRLEAKVQDLFMGLPVEVRSKFDAELPALTAEYMAKQDNIWKED